MSPIAPRLFVIMAARAPLAVIIRRGPASWVQLVLWDTKRDRFTPGSWFRGRIYEEKCDLSPDGELFDGETIAIAGETLRVLHTPGHAPGAVCVYAPGLGAVFTGDTLFNGGPGATGRSFSDHDTLVSSIRAKLFKLSDDTVVKTGHGDDTTIGAEKERLGTE